MGLSSSVRRGRPREKVAGVRLEALRAHIAEGDMFVTTGKAAALVRRCQDHPTVTRQVVMLWAQRHGERGTAYVYDGDLYTWGTNRMTVSLAWLAGFLERTGRGA